ncbi:hypothetical protein HMPREF1553_02296 [Porphyromonas gingivalis F0568]|nr:hypothetical protein HMPREF1553_02296 [Porphyromonas gingivalis F0568]
MSGRECVVFAFFRRGETADAPPLAQMAEVFAPAGQDLMAVSLMSHVPDDTVVGCIEYVVQRHRKVHCAQAGAEMTGRHRQHFQNIAAEFATYLWQLFGF